MQDLSESARQGNALVTIHLANFPPDADLLRKVAKLISVVKNNPEFTVTKDYATSISTVKTPKELAQALESAQNTWDANEELYHALKEEGDPEHQYGQWRISTVLSWAKAENEPYEFLTDLHSQAN